MAIKITSPGLPLSGGTVTGPILFPAGSLSAPSIAWSADADGTGTGFYRPAANNIDIASNGVIAARFSNSLLGVNSGTLVGWYSGAVGTTFDTILARNADGILQLKSDGTSAAEFRVYGDGTTAAKYISVGSPWLQCVGASKALTDNVATGFVKLSVAQGASIGARILFTVKVIDAGLDQQVEAGTVTIAAINKGGTVTAATPVVSATTALVTAGTLSATTFTVAEVDADTITISAQSDTSLTPTSHAITYFVETTGATTVTQL